MGMTLIQAQTLSSSAASVTFSSIPQTFKSLRLVVSARSDATNASGGYNIIVKPNNATANQTWRQVYGNGSAAGSTTQTALYSFANPSDYTASTFGGADITMPNYASSAYKTISFDAVNETNATNIAMGLAAGLWSDVTAISLLVISAYTGNFVSGSSFYLYGISG